MPTGPDVLVLTEGLPMRALVAGEQLFDAADTTQTIVVLVEGSLRVESGGQTLSVLDVPGAFVGEIGALLRVPRSADVVATTPTTVRVIGDPVAFFAEHPVLGLELARQLAGRLHRLTAYLSDVRAQYGDSAGHLGMVDSVLARLSSRPPVDIEPGSDRAPDY
ncbi:MAG: family transcriptional regulator, cyclic receptor protein [Frankiales bacterium]|jgi:CRP-like cAMP-binding protein|nr:family transcriptional regulator, cyclic receptor protein [Frankiales bacterium]